MKRLNFINRGQRLSPSARKIIKLRQRAFANGGASLELQIPTNYIRDISRDLNYDITSDASLIMTPNTIGEGRLYNCVPGLVNSDFQATRATTATVIQKDGSIGDSCYNLLQRSEEFDNAAWDKINSTVSANVTTSFNGNLTADKIVENTTTDFHYVRQQSFILKPGLPHIFTAYVKQAERTACRIVVQDALAKEVIVNLVNGAVLSNTTEAATVSDAGNGFWKITCQRTPTQTSGAFFIQPSIGTNASYLGDGVSGIYVGGAQLTIGTGLKDYLKTTNRLAVPSIDYGLGSNLPAILVEPARTNIVFPSATATTQTRTVTAQPYTLSFYGTGTVTLSGTFSGSLVGTGVNNLVSLTFTPTAGSLTFTITGTVTDWQCEAGSNATSRIVTTTATATRNNYTSFVDLQNNNALNKDNFTLFVEGYLRFGDTTNISFGLSDTTATGARANDIGFFDGIKATYAVGSTTTSDTTNISNENYYKFAIQRSGTSVKFFRNGAQIWTTQTIAVFDYRYLILNTGGSTFMVQKVALWKHTKSDSDCITLTT